MTYLDAIILGVIQGVTEFIPVSSDGHLALAENLGLVGDVPFFFTVSVHLGTLIATIFFFRNVILDLIKRLFQRDTTALSFFLALGVGTIPAGFAGILLNDSIDQISTSLVITGFGFLLSMCWLLGIHRMPTRKNKQIASVKDAAIIGLLQATALLPGASRSGATLFGGKLRGLSSEDAFTFSFLLSVPAILGALALQLLNAQVSTVPQSIVGGITSTIIGIGALTFLKKVVVSNKLYVLAVYCGVLGAISLLLAYSR